ncbi:MAG: HAD family hydrolase [Rhodothermales bacterium]|nr:HAD family hydrolase [Rhodothermales bacterium]
MTQLLHLETPVVFEAGGGMFDPSVARWYWHPDFTEDLDRQIRDMREWLSKDVAAGTAMDLDHAKKTQASLAGPVADEVLAAVPVVERRAEDYPDLLVAHTHISIDVIPRSLNKANGMRWLAEKLGIALEEIGFIGDTNGDLPALEIVGYPFAPANATETVKAAARMTTGGQVIDGVLEAYRWCVTHNEELNERESPGTA